MSSIQEKKHFKEFLAAISEVQDHLNWDLESYCCCGHKILSNVFFVILAMVTPEDSGGTHLVLCCHNCGKKIKWTLCDIQSCAEGGFFLKFGGEQFRFKGYKQYFIEGFFEASGYFTDPVLDYSPLFGNLSMSIFRMYISLECYLAHLTKCSLKDKGCSANEIYLKLLEYRPKIHNYKLIMEDLGLSYDQKLVEDIKGCARIRNKIVHDGHHADFDDFLFVFRTIGKMIK